MNHCASFMGARSTWSISVSSPFGPWSFLENLDFLESLLRIFHTDSMWRLQMAIHPPWTHTASHPLPTSPPFHCTIFLKPPMVPYNEVFQSQWRFCEFFECTWMILGKWGASSHHHQRQSCQVWDPWQWFLSIEDTKVRWWCFRRRIGNRWCWVVRFPW